MPCRTAIALHRFLNHPVRPVAILVFTAKVMVASFLVAQASLLPASPVSQVYGLSR